MTFTQAAEFHNFSLTTILNWKRRVHSRTIRQTKPYKIPDPDEVLLNDVKVHPNYYMCERASLLIYSKIGIFNALKKTSAHPKVFMITKAVYHSKFNSFTQHGYPLLIWMKVALKLKL